MPKVDTEWAVMFDAVGVLNVSREYGLPHRWDTHHADMCGRTPPPTPPPLPKHPLLWLGMPFDERSRAQGVP
jgi:hypothetical protein